jgi:CRISPR-associated endonuclease/helicase Cas3
MDELLAKPDVLLTDHLKEVLRLGDEIAHCLKLDERSRSKALLACALHDIGKATVDFQEYIRGKRGKAYPHALVSLPFVLAAEILLGQRYGWGAHDLCATAAVLTHHSPLSPQLYIGYDSRPELHQDLVKVLEAVWELLRRARLEELPNVTEFLAPLQPLLKDSPAAMLDATGVIPGGTLRGLFQNLPIHEFGKVKAVLHLADWLASANECDHTVLFLKRGRAHVEQHVCHFPLWDFQQRAGAAQGDILWLRAPTGTGKTEALLLWADDAERLIYLLPTQATANAMWKRLRQVYGNERVALAHGRASYILRKEADEDPLETRLFGSVFAKPVTVATLDQYLLAHLNGRHWEERRSLAHRATIILDEIHAYEPYTLGLLLEALERERPARLALASATLPSAILELFPKGELIEAEDVLWQRTRHKLEPRDNPLQEGLANAVEFAREGKTVLIVANTVREAQLLYQTVQDEFGWQQCHLLHARFIFRDRQEKEARVEKPQPGTIFIATQIVEVSLDISYDVLLTEVAPVDALVQRMGRVNRRGEKPPASVIVYSQWSKGSQRVYGKEILDWSRKIMASLPELPTDRDLVDATHRLYEHVRASEDWGKELQEGRQTLEEVQRILGCYTIDLSDEQMRVRFSARHGQISIEVLPQSFIQEAYALRERGEGWRMVELLVPVPIWWLSKFSDWFYPNSDLRCLVTRLPYDAEVGLLPPFGEGLGKVGLGEIIE